MEIIVWTILIASLTAITCSLCGLFLVLGREALVSEGLAHAVLPGIVIAFVVLRDRSSPLLIVSAALMGLVMVLLVQLIRRTGVVDGDASLGVVFPALFSIGILLASAELSNTHFHADCIIDGNLALSALDRLKLFGADVGPKPFWAMLGMLTLVASFLGFFFKEMKLMTFDSGLAETLGFRPQLLHVGWLALVSMTTVTAFETGASQPTCRSCGRKPRVSASPESNVISFISLKKKPRNEA
ncbi:MAG: metal ABC transporter permease, partial [Planctomycetota bacterium]